MAERERRVEPRGIIGTGMSLDPERLRDLERKAERFARDRALPKRKFGDVMAGADAAAPEGTELLNEAPPERERKGVKPRPAGPPPGTRSAPRPDARTARPAPQAPPAEAPAAAAPEASAGASPPPPESRTPPPLAPKPPVRPAMGAASPNVSSKVEGTRVTFKG